MHSYAAHSPAVFQAVRKLQQMNPDKFEVWFTRKTSTKIDSKNQEVDSLSRSEDVGLAIRLIQDQRMGFSYTTSLEKDAVDRLVQSAFDIAAVMPQDELVDLHSFGSSVYPSVDTWDAKGLAAPIEQKIALARRIEAECRESDKRITGVRAATFGETAFEVHLIDSNDEHIQHQSTLYTASITCKAEHGGDSQMGGEFGFSNYLDNLDHSQVARLAAIWATELLGAGQAPTMKCPAIIRNSVVAELLDFLSGSFSAEEIDKGRSMLAGKEGTRVFSDKLTIIDDGLMPGGIATAPFDGEGVPTSRTRLVDGGFFSGILYDKYYARKKGTHSTGSASRGIKSPPSIGFSNLFLDAAHGQLKKNINDLTSDISKGILITDLMGVHTANSVTGDFSLGASGILIENGKPTRPVKGFAVAGNVLELFRQMTDIGSDLRFFGNVGAPSIRVDGISISGI